MRVQRKRKHSLEYRIAAVQKSIDSPDTVNSVAKALEIHPALLSRWRCQLTRKPKQNEEAPVANEGPERSKAELERENRDLKRRLERAELEAEILKKAQQYFDKKLK